MKHLQFKDHEYEGRRFKNVFKTNYTYNNDITLMSCRSLYTSLVCIIVPPKKKKRSCLEINITIIFKCFFLFFLPLFLTGILIQRRCVCFFVFFRSVNIYLLSNCHYN